jgi:plasmid stabilization system protein ParE
MARKIILSNQAQKDRKEILNFWFLKTKSKAYSKSLNQQFNYSIKLLQTHPYIG